MASEMRRLAKALVEHRSESFASRYPRAESEERVRRALEDFAPRGLAYETAWRDAPEGPTLDVALAPSRNSSRFLGVSSILLTVLVASTAYVAFDPTVATATRLMLGLATTFAILGFPLVVVAYGSRREAEEATLRRAIKRALIEDGSALT